MSTYAYWLLWVGVGEEGLDWHTIASRKRIQKIVECLDRFGFCNIAGLKLRDIYMHGRKMGLGVEVVKLNWTTQIDRDNVFDAKKITTARSLVPRVSKLFKELGIKAPVKIYNHIDLGG